MREKILLIALGGAVGEPFMVTIGDGAVLGFGSVIAGSVIADGKISLGDIRIGTGFEGQRNGCRTGGVAI